MRCYIRCRLSRRSDGGKLSKGCVHRTMGTIHPSSLMMLRRVVALTGIVSLTLSMVPLTGATAFPDVSSGHPYAPAIRELALMQVIRGGQDGMFHPEDRLNRADFLVMIYRGLRRTPSEPESVCMKDVTPGSYYETVVCHALKQRFVTGYPDRTFKPGNPVSRAEAVTMLMQVMEFDMTLRAVRDLTLPSLVDVPSDAWFTAPVRMAYAYGILPISGWEGFSFQPEKPMTRGEAAALVWSGLEARDRMKKAAASSAPSSRSSAMQSSAASTSATHSEASVGSAQSSSVSSPKTVPIFQSVTFPYTNQESGKSVTDQFSLSAQTTVDVLVSQTDGRGPASCVLSAIDPHGFTLEYYQGYQDGRQCVIHATLAPGLYQLRTQTPDAAARFTVSAAAGKTDGNDGFLEAKDLLAKAVRTEWLDSHDLQDFYSFSVSGLTANQKGRLMSLRLVSSGLTCSIFPLANVDLDGFNGPACNATYLYPPGNYIVAVSRDPMRTPKATRQAYTIQLER